MRTSDLDLTETSIGREPGLGVGKFAVLEVADSGIGMDSATRACAFEPYFSTRPGRSGLGLSMVHGIVTQSGGTLALRSEPGRGTTLKVYLPAIAKADDSTSQPFRVGLKEGTETILLADDDEQVRDLLREILVRHGYTVVAASDGDEAVELAKAQSAPIDLLVTDVIMPRLSGPDAYAALAHDRPDLKVLFISGNTRDALFGYGPELPPEVPFLGKPFSPDALLLEIRAVLSRDDA